MSGFMCWIGRSDLWNRPDGPAFGVATRVQGWHDAAVGW